MFSLSKTEDIVVRRPGLRHFMNPPPVSNFEQVGVVNLANLLSSSVCFVAQVCNVL